MSSFAFYFPSRYIKYVFIQGGLALHLNSKKNLEYYRLFQYNKMVASKFILASSAIFSVAIAVAIPPLNIWYNIPKVPVGDRRFIRETDSEPASGEILSNTASDISNVEKSITNLQLEFISTSDKPNSASIQKLVSGVDEKTNEVIQSMDTILDPKSAEYSAAISSVVVGSFYQQVLNSINMALESLSDVKVDDSLESVLTEMANTLEVMEAQTKEQNMNDNLIQQIADTRKKILEHTDKSSTLARRQVNVLENVVSGVTSAKKKVDTLTNTLISTGSSPGLEVISTVLVGLDSQIDSVIGSSSSLLPTQYSEESSHALFNPFIQSVTRSTDELIKIMSKGPLDPILSPAVRNLETSMGNLANFAGKYSMKDSQTNLININHRIHLLYMDPAASPASIVAPNTQTGDVKKLSPISLAITRVNVTVTSISIAAPVAAATSNAPGPETLTSISIAAPIAAAASKASVTLTSISIAANAVAAAGTQAPVSISAPAVPAVDAHAPEAASKAPEIAHSITPVSISAPATVSHSGHVMSAESNDPSSASNPKLARFVRARAERLAKLRAAMG